MTVESQTTDAGREVYLVRRVNEKSLSWRTVDRSEFAREEGPAIACAPEEAEAKIAEAEGLQAECVYNSGGGFFVSFPTESLASALEFTKSSGLSIRAHYLTCRQWKNHLGSAHKVASLGNCDVVIDNKWIVESGRIEYNPDGAAEALKNREEWKERRKLQPHNPKGRQSRIPAELIWGVSGHLSAHVGRLRPFNVEYVGWRPWHDSNIFRCGNPRTKVQGTQQIVELARFYRKFTGKANYRTYGWKCLLEKVAKVLRGDVLAKSAFGRFVREERRALEKMSLGRPRKWHEKWINPEGGLKCQHLWEFAWMRHGEVIESCEKCKSTRTHYLNKKEKR